MFFFPEYTLNQMRIISPYLYQMLPKDDIEMMQEIFNYQCRRFLGLGFLLSFIPGTTAFVARNILSQELTQGLDSIQPLREGEPFFQKLVLSSYLQAPFLNFLLLGPLWLALDYALIKFNSPIVSIGQNKKMPFSIIFSHYFPVLSEFNSPYPVEHLLHSLLNPVRFIGLALFTVHLLLNRIFEIGSMKNAPSNFIVAGLKLITAIPFAIVTVPVMLIGEILDVPYQILKNFVYQPLKFIALAIAQPFRNTDALQARSDAMAVLDSVDENENESALDKNERIRQYHIPTTYHGFKKTLGSNSTTLRVEPTDDNDDSNQNTGTPRSRTTSLSGSPSNKFFDKNLDAPTENVIVVQENPHQDPGVTQIPGGPA